jgi:hypothetical protein
MSCYVVRTSEVEYCTQREQRLLLKTTTDDMDDDGEDEAGSIASYSTATGILKLQHLNNLILEDDKLLSLQEMIKGLSRPDI